ncbi:hypothetical protein IU438_28835 [Nocardia cyriacigeorgica]|uniref:hypothetical protein n=1 Tax=Nocardia cyriacigeorgica TaxID=135487 RepID=UPI0018961A91|nr:hypothetical protein [Nocardia cyriacigeorgica]MBF6399779.1 hypothetical protein [Nocardia cyriacigeorgica]MBF6405392.1 hypothetical protein [Nocardia cyriacigeorgica]
MSVIVTAPVVVVPDATGKLRYHYRGAVLDELSEHDYDRLVARGMVADLGRPAVAVVDPDPDGDGGPDGGGESGQAEQSGTGDLERPKQAAPKEAWVEYAVARGMSEAEAEDLTKAELIARLA